jgi:CRISPR/Cas system-associated exonuclease Cas4 (RecB family)
MSGRDPKELGTRVHAALEAADLEALRELEAEWGTVFFRAQPVIDWAERELLDLEKYREEWNELSFEVPIGEGETLVGSLDRLVRLRDGSFRILDYKVIDRSKPVSALKSRYRDQLWIYAWAIGRLEPEARDRTRASLVAISPQGVAEVEVGIPPSQELDAWIQSRWTEARRIVAGQTGVVRPDRFRCGSCDFRSICPEGVRQGVDVPAQLSLGF